MHLVDAFSPISQSQTKGKWENLSVLVANGREGIVED